MHQYYPVLSYPAGVRAAPVEELAAENNPGHWALPLRASDLVPSGERVRWADLIAQATPGVAAGTEGIVFPSPTLMCLIHCAHCFRSSVTRLHYMNPFGGFRLYELASIFNLARLPDFDAALFQILIERFSAYDAVRLMNTLAEAFLGEMALPGQDTDSKAARFPEHLIYGGWVALQQTDDWLQMRGIEEMFDQLDANVVPPHCVLEVEDVPRLLTYGRAADLLSRVGITWDATAEMISVEWVLADGRVAETEYELLLHFGYDSFVQVNLAVNGMVKTVVEKSDFMRLNQPKATATANSEEHCCTVRLTCPVPPVPRRYAPREASSLPLLIAFRRLSATGEGTEAAVYLPLRLTRR